MKVIICGSRKLFLEPSEVEQAVILSGFKITELGVVWRKEQRTAIIEPRNKI
jgi:hypothetical protein